MHIFGIDFTSAPRTAKPIVSARVSLRNDRLRVEEIVRWKSFSGFESFLKSSGPWIAGVDFPFGQPHDLVADLGLPSRWDEYVRHVAGLTKADFTSLLELYSKAAQPGQKHLMRLADKRASACSPMMLYGVPVAKMFFEGATRLQISDVSILPCRPTKDSRIAIETYPALVARRALGRTKYKSSSKRDEGAEKRAARVTLLDWLESSEASKVYGLSLEISADIHERCVSDATGDSIDAICCCLQAAWASRHENFGMPPGVNLNDGWIFDPATLSE